VLIFFSENNSLLQLHVTCFFKAIILKILCETFIILEIEGNIKETIKKLAFLFSSQKATEHFINLQHTHMQEEFLKSLCHSKKYPSHEAIPL
jgi:hypothetical protein